MSSESVSGPVRGLLIILSAPSGTGKTTLARRLCEAHAGSIFSISLTTRPPRGSERDGVDYRFVSEAEFDRLVEQGALAEWARVHDHRYGTLQSTVDEARRRDALALFDIDVQGGSALHRANPDAVRILLVPPSLSELERRLRARSTDEEATIRRRLDRARSEVELAQTLGYDYTVVNLDLETACADLLAIVRAERCRAGRLPDFHLA